VNLILALAWLIAACAFGGVYLMDPDAPDAWVSRGVPACVALAMTLYNLVRWWTTRRRRNEPGPLYTRLRRRDRPSEPAEERFQLVDEPPPVRRPRPDENQPPDREPPRSE